MYISKKKIVSLAASVAVFAIAATSFTPAQAAPKNQARAVVQADWLEKNLDDPKVVVIEVSTEPGIYERGHIRNSVKITWHTDLVDTVNRDVVSATNFQKFAQAAGISQDTTVVLYGDKNNWFAAWGAWIFNLYGAKDVRILDGGLGTGAVTRVLIETAEKGRRWTTVGVSENVIAASWLALEDAISYGLLGKAN